jgi:hypothetical protein
LRLLVVELHDRFCLISSGRGMGRGAGGEASQRP